MSWSNELPGEEQPFVVWLPNSRDQKCLTVATTAGSGRIPLDRLAALAKERQIVCKTEANVLGRETLRLGHINKGGIARTSRQTGLSLRGIVTTFALIAFFLSGIATQTHIHVPGQSDLGFAAQPVAAEKVATKSTASRDREQHPSAPTDDLAHCSLCQAFLVAGAYVVPAPVILAIPVSTTIALPSFTQSAAVVWIATHSWLSRAPPLA